MNAAAPKVASLVVPDPIVAHSGLATVAPDLLLGRDVVPASRRLAMGRSAVWRRAAVVGAAAVLAVLSIAATRANVFAFATGDLHSDADLSRAKHASYDTGHNTGYNTGYSEGHDAGYGEGQEAGFSDGKTLGYSEGQGDAQSAADDAYDNGYNEGYDAGQADTETTLSGDYDSGYYDGIACAAYSSDPYMCSP
jgi:hypothetical protein